MNRIVNTQPSDLPFIYWLYDEAIAYQKRNGYPTWPDYDKDVLRQDIAQQLQFKVLNDGSIHGIFSICYADEMVWRERENGQAFYLHRIVVNPKQKGKRLFGRVLNWARQRAQEKQRSAIRMDTWANNPTIIAYYQNFGFKIVGYYTTPDSEALPVQQRSNDIVLLEYILDQTKR